MEKGTKSKQEVEKIIGLSCIRGPKEIPIKYNIYQLTEDPDIDPDCESPEYIGYDKIALNYDARVNRGMNTDKIHQHVAKRTLEHIRIDNPFILDVGAGTGEWSIPFAKNNARVIALDISNNMLQILMKKAESEKVSIPAVRANAISIPIDDMCFDVVIINSLLHLVRNPERIISEALRILKIEGALITTELIENTENNPIVAEKNNRIRSIWNEAYKLHHELSIKNNQKHTPRPGWWENKQHDNISKYFDKYEKLILSDTTFESVHSLKDLFKDLHNIAFSDKIRFNPDINEKIVQEVEIEIESKYGKMIWDIEERGMYCNQVNIYHK